MATFATPKWNPVLAYLVTDSITENACEVRSLWACYSTGVLACVCFVRLALVFSWSGPVACGWCSVTFARVPRMLFSADAHPPLVQAFRRERRADIQ